MLNLLLNSIPQIGARILLRNSMHTGTITGEYKGFYSVRYCVEFDKNKDIPWQNYFDAADFIVL